MISETGPNGGRDEDASPRALFVARLAQLWEAAGNPTLQRVATATEARLKAARAAAPGQRSSMQRISDWRTGRNVPSRFESLDPVLVTLISLARQTSGPLPPDLSNRSAWRRLWKAASAQPVRPTVLTTLRRDVPTFVGRDAEVQRILDAAGPDRVVSIHTVDGMPGVGKTALVVRAAHLLSDRFPDGRFFVELNSHTPGQVPADPAAVLATLLTGLGIAPGHIPDTLDARRDLWRDRVAGKRMLLVLDDARDHAQIEPLLPAGPECLTLITSRRRLVALDSALPLPLGTLEPDSAIDLFCRLAQRNPTGDELAAVAEIVQLCGYLPLAIVLLAGRLAHHPAWTLAGLAEEFRTAQDRLGELDAGQRAVRAAFTASYESLPPARRQLFRRLGLHPGPDFDPYAVAALHGSSLAEARAELEALFTCHLVEETTPGRYCLHDLVREYACALAVSSGEDSDAMQRLLDYYRAAAAAADHWLTRRPRRDRAADNACAVPEFDNERPALAWLRRERANLLACLDHTAECDPARMVGLTEVLAELLEREGPWPTARQLHRRAAAAAGRLGNRLGRADALTNLGTLEWQTGNFDRASDLLRQALALYRETGHALGTADALRNLGTVEWQTGNYDRTADLFRQALTLYQEADYPLGEANTLAGLGGARRDNGDYEQATQLLEQALDLYRDTGFPLGEANTLASLGGVRRDNGDYEQATRLLEQALALFQEAGYPLGEANALGFLGSVRREIGDYRQAADLFRHATALFQEIGHRRGEANALGNLGLVHRDTGDHAQAAAVLRQALVVSREIGHRIGEAVNLNYLATVHRETRDYGRAADLSQQALIVFRDTGYRIGEAEALANLGAICGKTGQRPKAAELSRQALALFRQIGYRAKEAEALNNTAKVLLAAGAPAEALTMFAEALTVARAIGCEIQQAHALAGTARCHTALGDTTTAATLLRQAIDIYHHLGAPETEDAATDLATLHPV
ncbi:tetratricopeptide repeat protein [Nocardia brasiliensis]|uniref:tetratricopeptide repeat protein n=1 Tax=Nocardia brasiliensis TaxID=37326 RepID=UPI000ABAA0AF|nr:tetratricopeptide repeat protein [Nocardia brasiliensis]